MPRSIAEIRKANGGLDNLTDEDILQSTFQQYKNYYPSLDAYAAEVGYGGAGRSLAGSRISAGVDQYQAGLLGLGGAIARGIGAEGVASAFDRRRQANEAAAAYAQQQAADLGGISDFRDVTGVGSALNYAGGLAAQSLPYLGEAAAGALTGGIALGGTAARMGLSRAVASQAGAVAAGYPSAVGDVLSAQREAGGERLGAAALGGIPYAALNAIGIEGQLARGLRPIVDVGGSLTRRVAAGAGMGAVGESIGETGQEIVNQVAGRMAVDPNETIFNEAANRRYIDAAVGGATLGGLFGAAGGVRGPQRPGLAEESDLTQQFDTTTRPDPSQFVTQDQTVGLKKFIDETTGVVRPSRKGYEKQFEAAFNEPSGQFVSDAATGVERELTVGELMQRGSASMDLTQDNPADATAAAEAATKVATTRDPRDVFLRDELKVVPNNNSRQLFNMMEEQGIDPKSPAMVPVWNYAASKYMTPSRLTKATELMDAAIIKSRQEAPSVSTPVSTVQQPAGSVGVVSPVVQGSVGDAGRPAPVAGTMVRSPAVARAPLQQAGVLPVATSQPSTPVTTGESSGTQAPQTIQAAPQGQATTTVPSAAPAVKGNKTLRLVKQEKVDDQEAALSDYVEIARETGNTAGIDAALADAANKRQDQRDFTKDDIDEIIELQVGKGKNKERDRQILRAYVIARKFAPYKDKGKVKAQVGKAFGVTASRVGQIGNPEKLADIAVSMGFDRNQVFTELGIQSTKEEAVNLKQDRESVVGEADTEGTVDAAEVVVDDTAEGDVEALADDARFWQKSSTAGSTLAVQLVQVADAIEAVKAAKAELEQLGVTEAAESIQARIEELTAKYEAITVAAAEKTAPKAAPVSKATATVKEAQQRWKDAGRDITKLSSEDLGLLLPYVRDTIKNTELAGKITAELANRGETNAVQVESPASVPVQPKAETGQGVVAKVRRAQKPAAESKAQVPAVILTQAEQAAQAWDVVAADYPQAPKFADLTKAQQNNFIGFGEENWTKADVETELTKMARTSKAVVPWSNVALTTKGDVEVVPTASLEGVDQRNKADTTTPEYKALKASIQAKGIVNPIILTTNSLGKAEVFEGNHRLQVAKELGLAEVPVVLHSRTNQSESYPVVGRKPSSLLPKITREPVTIDVEARVVEETVAPQVAKLPAPQVTRLENHYGVKRDSAEFLAKVKADVVLYATKGAEAVAGAIRDVIKAIHAGVLSVAMIFNPTAVSQIEAFVVIPQETQTTTQQVLAELPAEVQGMSEAGKQAYATLIPALKGKIGDKFVTIADKPSGRVFVFKANGDLVLQKKALFGLAKGDLYKGNNDLKQNRVTPAGLFGINIVDAAKGGDAAKTAGDYDFGKVFALDDPDATVTFMHSVWLKESDAAKRAAALKNDSAADSRYSFGCINVDKETFKDMVGKYSNQMDGSKLFVVPDVQSTVNDFITGNVANDRLVREGVQPVTKTTTTPVKSATQTAGVERTVARKEEEEAATPRQPKLRALRTVTTTDADNASVELQEQELARLEKVPGVGNALSRFRKEGLGNLVDYVGGWYVTDSNVDWDGGFTAIDGQAAVLLRRGALTDSERVEWTVYHEVGHAADQTHLEDGGVFSSQPEFNVRLEKGKIKPVGSVMKEAFDFYTNNPTSDLAKHLSYPFNRAQHSDLDGDGIREELFAQLWATYTTRDGREFLEDNLPTVADFMEQAYEQVKQTDYVAAAANEAQNTAKAGGQATQGNGQSGQVPLRQTAVRFRAIRPQGLIDRNIAKLPQQSQQPVRRVTEAIGDLGGKYLDYAVFTNDLVKRAQALGLGAAKTFSDRLAARNAKVSEEERKIEKIADRYALIEDDNKGDGPGSVNEFLFESTRTGKWGYTTAKFKADPAMKAMFDKLGPKAQQFVKDVFAHGDATLSNKKKIVLDATNSEYDAMIKAAQVAGDTQAEAKLKAEKVATLKRFQTLFRIREGIPYAPIKRTGAYVVIGESAAYKAAKANKDTATIKKLESDPDHYHVSFVDTKWQARNLSDKLAEQGVFDGPQIVKRSESFDEAFSGEAMLPALTKMRAAVDRRAQDANGKKDPTAGKLLNIINQLYLEALAEGSARKSEMRRRGVAGEVDMLQSFTQQGRADANFLAGVEFEPKIQDALQQMRNQSRTGDRERKSEIFDELTQRYADSLDPKPSPFINGLTNMASKFFLASSPGYYLQNLTQPFMMSLPAMAGRHDYTKAAKELFNAYAELGPMFKDVKLFDQQFDFSKVPADVRAAVNDLVNQGKIDIGLATEINEYKVEADSNLSKFAQRLNKGMRMAVQKVEATNRLSTAIAAYRLEFARTNDAAKATQYAADILTETHGDYTAFNAPRAFNTQWGKVALQFRKFQLIQIAFYAKLIRDAFTNPAERAAALKTLGYSLGHTAVFAGMMGLPGYAAISAILGAFGDDDEKFDLTAEMRKALGPEWADMVMRGAPTVVGMDLSGKIGAGNMLSIMPFSDADLSTNAGRAEAFGTLMGGAALGMTSRVIDGLGLIASGDYYKGIERTMPKGVSDALKAGRQGAEGMTRRNGDVVLPDSEVSALDTVWTAMGLPAVKQAVTYERQNRMRDVTENFNDRTTRIKNDYAKAVREQDTQGMAEARAAWMKLQQTRQRNGLQPQPVSALLKAPQEQKAREKRTVEGVAYREGQRKLAESIAAN